MESSTEVTVIRSLCLSRAISYFPGLETQWLIICHPMSLEYLRYQQDLTSFLSF